MEQVDFSNKEIWTKENAEMIAAQYGYCYTSEFLNALKKVGQIAQETKVVGLLGPVAHNIFRNWNPPLERVISKSAPSVLTQPKTPNGGLNIFKWIKTNH